MEFSYNGLSQREYQLELEKQQDESDIMGAIFPNWRLTSSDIHIQDGVLPSSGHCLPLAYIRNPGPGGFSPLNVGPVKFANIKTRQTFLVAGNTYLEGAELLSSKGGWLLLRSPYIKNKLPLSLVSWERNKACINKPTIKKVGKNKTGINKTGKKKSSIKKAGINKTKTGKNKGGGNNDVSKESNRFLLVNATSGARLELPSMRTTTRPRAAFTLTDDGVPDLVLYAHLDYHNLSVWVTRPGDDDWVVHTTPCDRQLQ